MKFKNISLVVSVLAFALTTNSFPIASIALDNINDDIDLNSPKMNIRIG